MGDTPQPPSDAPGPSANPPTGVAQSPSPRTEASGGKRPALLVVGVVILLALIGGALYVGLAGSPSSDANSSAPAAASAVANDLRSGDFTQVCSLAPDAQRSKCRNDLRSLSAGSVSYKVAVGNVIVSGNRALLVMTGTVCLGTGQCLSNHDVNAAMTSGQTFDQAYAVAAGNNSSSPFIVPLVQQDGKWYVTGF